MKNILITGGLGYLGSHAVVAFEQAGYNTIIVDNLDNSCLSAYRRISKILGKTPKFYELDIRDYKSLDQVFIENNIDGVIHFAGLKAVGESCEMPLLYFDNNIIGSIKLFEVMEKHSVKNLIFSSSATVYNSDNPIPYKEGFDVGLTSNPYGTTKYIIEKIMNDLSRFSCFNVINLRYFNPIGAHPSGLIGENPEGTPNNLFPYIMKVISGELKELSVFGSDYKTKDGTGVRDYIDVNDLVDGHLKAFKRFEKMDLKNGNFETYNLGTGKGTSVLEMVKYSEKVSGKKINYVLKDRRYGDIGEFYCDPTKAWISLGWEATTPIEESIRTGLLFNEIKNNNKDEHQG